MDNTCRTVAADAVFRIFTACPTDPRTLILDVRDKKHFDRGHIAGAYCIRVPSNGATLLGGCCARPAGAGWLNWGSAGSPDAPNFNCSSLPRLAAQIPNDPRASTHSNSNLTWLQTNATLCRLLQERV